MLFEPLDIPGAFCIKPEKIADERGFFARTFCSEEFLSRDLVHEFSQSSISFNPLPGTVRGMHYSAPPFEETKLVRCTAGAIFDVLVDLRQDSPKYLQCLPIELSAQNRMTIYIPTGVAHGFQVLQDNSEVLYMIDVPFNSASARGIRWNDPSLSIEWPEPITKISSRDLAFPDWPTRTF